MKDKQKVAKRRLPDQAMPLPDPPLIPEDVPGLPCPVLTHSEFVAMMNAYHTYQVARADFEKKHGAVTLKLLLGAELQSQSFEVEFNQRWGLIVTDRTSIPSDRIVIGEGDSRPMCIR
jgi:hypothetical protein